MALTTEQEPNVATADVVALGAYDLSVLTVANATDRAGCLSSAPVLAARPEAGLKTKRKFSLRYALASLKG